MLLLLLAPARPTLAADIAYRSDGETVTIAACYGDDENIVLPAELDGLPVAAIQSGALSGCPQLRQLDVPATVTAIGEELFGEGRDVTIRSTAGSYAQRYSAAHGLRFQALAATDSTPTVSTAAGSLFSDVNTGDWFHAAVQDLHDRGIVAGYNDGSFRPYASISRAEFVKLLATASGDGLAAYRGRTAYRDVRANSWCAPYIGWAAANGVATGRGGGIFAPNGKISRQEMMTMLYRYHRYRSAEALPVLVSEAVFSDAAQVAAWAQTEVKALQMAGLISGKGNYRLSPRASATRAEAAQMVSRFIALSEDDASTPALKGLLLVAGEGTYWCDGLLRTAAAATVVQDDVLLVSLTLYAGYHGCPVAESGGGQTVSLPGGDRLTFRAGEASVGTSGGRIDLPAAVLDRDGDLLVPLAAVAAYFGDESLSLAEGKALLLRPQGQTEDASAWLYGYGSLYPSPPVVTVTTASYGTSGRGRDLSYCEIAPSDYDETIMLVFEQHGFEDGYARDGQVLVAAAAAVVNEFRDATVEELHNTRLIVVASANPDGLAEGTTSDGPGRCTIVGRTDMNRNWPTGAYRNRSNARNYTAAPLSVRETQALRDLITQTEPDMLIDVHGWQHSVLGDSRLAAVFHREMGLPYGALFSTAGLAATDVSHLSDAELDAAYEAGLIGFGGYLIGYGQEQGIRSALVELHSPSAPNIAGLLRSIRALLAQA